MSVRWLTSGLALLAASALGCDNQGKGVGPDLVDELCEFNRQAIEALHTQEGVALENSDYIYCDYLVEAADGSGTMISEVQPSCKPLQPEDMKISLDNCQRSGNRAKDRCWDQMQAALSCMKQALEAAANPQVFFTGNFDCWIDGNGNSKYDGGVFWTLPEDGSRPDAPVNHPEACGASGTASACGADRCYLLTELGRKGDETIANGGVAVPTSVNTCKAERDALTLCAQEPPTFFAGTAGAGQ